MRDGWAEGAEGATKPWGYVRKAFSDVKKADR